MKVGVIGGSGYIGRELIRILLGHPPAELTAMVSRQHVGKVHSNLRGYTTLNFSPLDVDYTAKACEVVLSFSDKTVGHRERACSQL